MFTCSRKMTDYHYEEIEAPKCPIIHGSSILSWKTCNCDRIFAKVEALFCVPWVKLWINFLAIWLLENFFPLSRGSLFKILHSSQALDIRRRMRMALDVVCIFQELYILFLERINFVSYISVLNPIAGKGYELLAQKESTYCTQRPEIFKPSCWQKVDC